MSTAAKGIVAVIGVCLGLAGAGCDKKAPKSASGATPPASSGLTRIASKPAPTPPPPARHADGPMPAPTPPPPPAAAPVTREDGLVVQDLVLGTGAECKAETEAVVAHYRVKLKNDGRELDSSYKLKQPVVIALGQLVKGCQDGVPGMKVGGTRRIEIPYALGHGEAGRPPAVPPRADLVFDIELVNVLQFEDTAVGDGAECPPDSTVKVRYRGTLKEGGREFDSGEVERSLSGLIQGWQYGVPGMKVGGKRKLVIPWQMAYGDRGYPPRIPPKADLVFDIELLDVK